jgi:two-component system LytT family response regulator
MKTIIIDNEPKVLEGLCQLIRLFCPELEIIGTADSVRSGIDLLRRQTPDLLFLDVELGDGAGMDVLNALTDRSFQLIFITAYEKYAVDAFRFSAVEFLLKPIDPDDLITAVSKAREQIDALSWKLQLSVLMENYDRLSHQERRMVINNKESIHIIQVKEIQYCEASGGYTFLHLGDDRKILASKNLKHFEELLLPCGFHRVHHSFLVNLQAISRYDRADCILELRNGATVPVSSRKKDTLTEVLNGQIFL